MRSFSRSKKLLRHVPFFGLLLLESGRRGGEASSSSSDDFREAFRADFWGRGGRVSSESAATIRGGKEVKFD